MEAILKSSLGSIPLRNSVLRIGRSPNNRLFINHGTVSRHHAEIRPDGRGFSLVDLGSTSGTFVNGERLVPQMPRVLRPGDTLKVGSFTLTYEERSLSLPLEDMTTIPIPGSVSSNDSLPGVSARNGGMDQLQARDEMLAVPEALPLAPASGGLLHVANTPTMLSPMPGSINGHAGGAGRNLGRVTPVPDSLQKPAGRTGVSSTPLTPLPSGEQGQLLKFARQQLQFTAFYPREVAVEHWQTLLVYAHVPAALGVVREDAQRVKDQPGAGPAQVAGVESSTAGETQMTVVPLFPGVTFQPERISFPLTSTWQPAVLRFSVERGRIGTVATGEILLLAGPLIIAALRVALRCVEPGARTDLAQEEVSVARYKNICTSYSQEDTSIVQALHQAYGALGDESFQDIEALRSGANWQSIMPRAIDGADVFQLFWSPNAAQSQLVYQECQYALQHYKYDGFMRPIYWQKPLGFCPPEFAHLAFTYYDLT